MVLRMRRPTRNEIAAAALVDLSNEIDRNYLRSTVTRSRNDAQDAWRWYEAIGEVHYAISRSAKIAGYARLRAVRVNPSGTIEETIESGPAAEIVDSIYSPYGGTRGLLQRFYTLMKVPGDSLLVRCRDENNQPDGWMFLSSDEVDTHTDQRSGIKWITLPSGAGRNGRDRLTIDVAPDDVIGRVWMPSSRFVELADSPMKGLSTECEVLHELTETLKAKIRSRFALAGILYLPNEINDINIAGPAPDPTNTQDDKILTWLIQAMTRNVMHRDEASTFVPILLRGPSEVSQAIRHILLDSEIFRVDIELRSELVRRILMGLDVQQDAVQGTGDTNHWAAWAVSDEERRISVQPDLEIGCWAITRMILHRELLNMGIPPDEIANYAVWYDLSPAQVRANQQEDSRQLHDRFALSATALRRIAGISEADAPTEDEYIRMVGVKMNDPYLATFGLNVDVEKITGPSVPGPPPEPGGDDIPVGPGVGNPGSPDDNKSDVPRSQRPA